MTQLDFWIIEMGTLVPTIHKFLDDAQIAIRNS